MNFRETLGRFLLAMEKRDLDALAATLADTPILISPEGDLHRTKGAFVEAYRGWFATKNWTLHAKPVEIYEGGSLGIAVLRVDYSEGGKSTRSYLTLVFERAGEEWLMAQSQSTPTR
jgi:ketosteroid isomerase-like protein